MRCPPVPMDYAGADLQGGIGYMFLKALHNEFQQAPDGSEGCGRGHSDHGRPS